MNLMNANLFFGILSIVLCLWIKAPGPIQFIYLMTGLINLGVAAALYVKREREIE